jgi:tRNA pseudouridine38-40 synthase
MMIENPSRIKCIVAYDGTEFQGWQVQPGARTIQSEVEKALAILEPEARPRIQGSGRTDAGVHAVGQVFHADVLREFSTGKWRDALNGLLPEDIRILAVEKVDENFHSRFSARRKEYRYFIHTGPVCPPTLRWTRHVIRRPLEVTLMKEAAEYLVGTHDFRSFSAIRVDAEEDTVRTLRRLDLMEQDSEIIIRAEAEGFLYKMVRQLVGALIRVGRQEMTLAELVDLRDNPRISHDAPSAPAKGLFLWRVEY